MSDWAPKWKNNSQANRTVKQISSQIIPISESLCIPILLNFHTDHAIVAESKRTCTHWSEGASLKFTYQKEPGTITHQWHMSWIRQRPLPRFHNISNTWYFFCLLYRMFLFLCSDFSISTLCWKTMLGTTERRCTPDTDRSGVPVFILSKLRKP